MSQHASFHQHVSYNLRTILHDLTAGKSNPKEISDAFSQAGGLSVITKVVSGKPLPRPLVVSLCCAVARTIIGLSGEQVELGQVSDATISLVQRLQIGLTGDETHILDCFVESARLMSAVACRDPHLLLTSGALAEVEHILETQGGVQSSILGPCCEALECISRTGEGRSALIERGTAGVLLGSISDFPDFLLEDYDVALVSALKTVERCLTRRDHAACNRALTSTPPETNSERTPRSEDKCVRTLLTVAEACETARPVGNSAGLSLWWIFGGNNMVTQFALESLFGAETEAPSPPEQEFPLEGSESPPSLARLMRLSLGEGKRPGVLKAPRAEVSGSALWAKLLEDTGGSLGAARLLAALGCSKVGAEAVMAALRERGSESIAELTELCGSEDPRMAHACLRIVERAVTSEADAEEFVAVGALSKAVAAATRFGSAEVTGDDAEARALAAALAAVTALVKADGDEVSSLLDETFHLGVRCLGGVGEVSGRPAAAISKAALDLITCRLTRSSTLKRGPKSGQEPSLPSNLNKSRRGSLGSLEPTSGHKQDISRRGSLGSQEPKSALPFDVEEDTGKDGSKSCGDNTESIEALQGGGVILAAMASHPQDARVQEAGWRALIAMDTGRRDVEMLFESKEGAECGHELLRSCLERHGGDSGVVGEVVSMLQNLGLDELDTSSEATSDGTVTPSNASPSKGPLMEKVSTEAKDVGQGEAEGVGKLGEGQEEVKEGELLPDGTPVGGVLQRSVSVHGVSFSSSKQTPRKGKDHWQTLKSKVKGPSKLSPTAMDAIRTIALDAVRLHKRSKSMASFGTQAEDFSHLLQGDSIGSSVGEGASKVREEREEREEEDVDFAPVWTVGEARDLELDFAR
ncbi:unnamed protein product, partial [Choristocarpus tenellus]